MGCRQDDATEVEARFLPSHMHFKRERSIDEAASDPSGVTGIRSSPLTTGISWSSAMFPVITWGVFLCTSALEKVTPAGDQGHRQDGDL